MIDALGYPINILISPSNRNDCEFAINLLSKVNIEKGCLIIADKGYDTDAILDYAYQHDAEPVIPSRSLRKHINRIDLHAYKERHLVENFFCKLKAFRRVATRYDKTAHAFLGFVCLASVLIWLL